MATLTREALENILSEVQRTQSELSAALAVA
jgi:hypothetical protein